MVTNKCFDQSRARQRGVALIMAMTFLLILTLIGVTTMSTTALQEKMAGNAQDKHVAFQAAESALRVGENQVQTATPADTDFTSTGTSPGLFLPAAAGSPPAWDFANWGDCVGAGGSFCLAGVSGVKTQPAYIIEFLGSVQGATRRSASTVTGFAPPPAAGMQSNMYRITARGTGGTDSATARVQSVYRR